MKWFKGDLELSNTAILSEADRRKYLVEKDILGVCRLVIREASIKEDEGLYKCKIEKTKHVTKTTVKLSGLN